MDFAKSCTTNIHVLPDFQTTRYSTYTCKEKGDDHGEKWSALKRILGELRHRRVLSTSVEDDLWLFGDPSSEHAAAVAAATANFTLKEEGILAENLQKIVGNNRRLEDLYLESIERCLAYRLSQEAGMLHVSPWTWLYTSQDSQSTQSDTVVVRLNVKTWPDRSLYLLPGIDSKIKVSIPHMTQAGDRRILAPTGQAVFCLTTAQNSLDQNEPWKIHVRQMLAAEGICLSDHARWYQVQSVDDSSTSFTWPADLCLAVAPNHLSDTTQEAVSTSWERWFGPADSAKYYQSPLATAETWFKSAGSREVAATETGAGPPTSASAEFAVPATTNSVADSMPADIVASPLFTHRSAEQQAAMSGIYPTPPDGLAPAALSQIHTDTNLMHNQAEQLGLTSDVVMDAEDSQYRDQRFDSSASQQIYRMDSQGGIFGPSGEMEFGDNEVGDADFSFFDEPDDRSAEAQEPISSMVLERTQAHDHTHGLVYSDDSPQDISQFSADQMSEQEPAREVSVPDGDAAMTGSTPTPCVDGHQDIDQAHNYPAALEKPLSPFAIKERLFPPPVPASLSQRESRDLGMERRESTFSPVVFRDGLSSFSKYGSVDNTRLLSHVTDSAFPDISLPPHRKKARSLKPVVETSRDDETESEEDSYESSTSDSEDRAPPRLPWDTRKRRRFFSQDDSSTLPGSPIQKRGYDEEVKSERLPLHGNAMYGLLEKLHRSDSSVKLVLEQVIKDVPQNPLLRAENDAYGVLTSELDEPFPPVKDVHNLSKQDLLCVAQIVGEQAVTCLSQPRLFTAGEPSINNSEQHDFTAILDPVEKAIDSVLDESEILELSKAAMVREPLSRNVAGQGKITPGQPRPPLRADSMILGPEFFPLAPPFIKIQRGSDDWEMLPPSLSFWEALGLGPANGPKNVRAFCIFPFNEDLQLCADRFISELGTTYENHKLGLHVHRRDIVEENELDNYEDGMAPVELIDDFSLTGVLKAYATTCTELGKALATLDREESGKTTVIYMLNPFPVPAASQHLCACFWLLFKTYRENLPRASKNRTTADILLQLVPVDIVASFDGLSIPDGRQMATLAREVYDRCPPSSSRLADRPSALPILASPSVELAGPASKKVMFQLVADPPNDLMHEFSMLHLAYSRSPDGQWLSAAWSDNTGQSQATAAACIRGRSFAEAAKEIWERTLEILAARKVIWRVYIVTDDALDEPVVQCWKTLSATPRAQTLFVTLLELKAGPMLAVKPPMPPVSDGPASTFQQASDAGVFTPVSTPQGANMTNSPDVSNHTAAPPTPAPSDAPASAVEIDPESYLVDLSDESWAAILSSKVLGMMSDKGVVMGLLFKRGEADFLPAEPLPSLSVCLHWTIQVVAQGSANEHMRFGEVNIRFSEMTLREVLKMYRNLAVLTRVRGLNPGITSLQPVPVAVAKRSAEGLRGLLREG